MRRVKDHWAVQGLGLALVLSTAWVLFMAWNGDLTVRNVVLFVAVVAVLCIGGTGLAAALARRQPTDPPSR